MKRRKIMFLVVSLIIVFTLSACGGNTDKEKANEGTTSDESTQMDHANMDHSSSGEVPNDLKTAENPTYKVGSKLIIKEGHMEGMKGAEATVVGAYDTIAYAVSYNPTTGGEGVTNHKWVIHEEIPEAGAKPLQPGAEVTLEASHMSGMDGATAKIDSAEKTTVYMIDYTPTTGGEKVTNHKWVTESELAPLENE
ncbi:DUF1541 domain-containing protein [Bacillus infantis]|uniref:DUF1541 domain-containing protein n=1 Tax=Bacillus infantis TaxID=324767 RepID=UPI0020036708